MELRALMEHLFHLYGRRNRIFLSGLRERIDFLNLAIGDLQNAVRKEAGLFCLEVALARVVARIICIAESFYSLPLVEVLVKKYPASHCTYCGQSPCRCLERRPGYVLVSQALGEQLRWGLGQWSTHLNGLYGEKNRQRGIENVINRLFKEVSELLSLQMGISRATDSLGKIEEDFALELADTLAWTIAVANLLGIDIEKATLDRFGQGCWNCHQNPCICGNFNIEPVDWPTWRP